MRSKWRPLAVCRARWQRIDAPQSYAPPGAEASSWAYHSEVVTAAGFGRQAAIGVERRRAEQGKHGVRHATPVALLVALGAALTLCRLGVVPTPGADTM